MMGFFHDSLNLVETIVINNALPESTSNRISLLSDTVGPTGLVVLTLPFTILESSETILVLTTSLSLIWTVLLDAVLRGEKHKSFFSFFLVLNAVLLIGLTHTTVFLGTFSNIHSICVTSKAEGPAGLFGSALF